IALGAERAGVMRMILTQALVPTLAGIAIGGGGAWMLTRLMQTLLFGITPSDPVTFGAVALLLTWVAAAAAAIPGLRASRVDPIVALRSE
ncbi:MAG: FtsX-like permease family protein, partial [Vicinamibacterales bacterium]